MRTDYGLPKEMPSVSPKALRLFWAKVNPPNAEGCWEWNGAIHPNGYAVPIPVDGSYIENGRVYLPHRLSFHWFKYDLPEGLVIDHLCNNRKCVNPDHLEATTQKHNVGRALKRSYCKRGHPQVDVNRYVNKRNGRSRCKLCINATRREAKGGLTLT